MSWIDTIGSKIMPFASEDDRAEARRKAEDFARDHEWIAMILDAHRRIEQLFEEGLNAGDPQDRRRAAREVAELLTGHSTAEEAVIYPAFVDHNGPISGKIHAAMAYEEHQVTKIQLAKLEQLDPMSDEWRNKLDHIRKAVQQHMYQEEKTWLPELASEISTAEHDRLTRRYSEEFEHYCGKNAQGSGQGRATTAGGQVPPDVPPPGVTSF